LFQTRGFFDCIFIVALQIVNLSATLQPEKPLKPKADVVDSAQAYHTWTIGRFPQCHPYCGLIPFLLIPSLLLDEHNRQRTE
ncbi:hypothetical protein ABEW34_29655, partial [Paenibacillus algorifonticola]|uniref:hypothetical protein n=1 Tax=Paenibacillus algorifonticola TaxID=684063 RepID=UPI003D28CB5D